MTNLIPHFYYLCLLHPTSSLQLRGLALTDAEGLCTRCVAENTASCVLTEASPGYDCTCSDGYAGTRCQYDLCAEKCNDDGTATCTKSSGDATCNCNDGWTGEGCSIDLCTKVRTFSFVRKSIAFHRGTILYQSMFNPSPLNLHTKRTEKNCQHQFCDDTGTASCTKSPGDFACNCADNYGGQYCQIDLCARCNDAGTSSCTGGAYEWTCNCAVSVEACCSTYIFGLSPFFAILSSASKEALRSFHHMFSQTLNMILQDGWVGDRCDIDLCDKFCDDTGTASCTKSPGDFACNCADNYGGQYCQIDLCARCNDAGTSSCTGGAYEWTCNCAVSAERCFSSNYTNSYIM